jgi:hypothetical protein
MRALVLALATALTACGPAYTTLHGNTDVTITPMGGGDGVARAGPMDGEACLRGGYMTLRLGDACALDAAFPWHDNPHGVGGHGDVTPGQRCTIRLGATTTSLVVQNGVITQQASAGAVDATIGGLTEETPQRYVTFHFAGTDPAGGPDRALWCQRR